MKWLQLLAFTTLLITAAPFSASARDQSVAFYYGVTPPAVELQAFDLVVVDPDQNFNPASYRSPRSEALAYVSIGEADPRRAYSAKISEKWRIGENKTWGTAVLDQANPAWRDFFVNEVVESLWNRGYRGFFLDTVDSYRLAVPSSAWQGQIEGLVSIIRAIKNRHPDAKIILNRGFEIVPAVKDLIHAVAAESLFQQWNQDLMSYGVVPESSREWLLGELARVKALGIPVIAIDYVPPGKRELARETAGKIKALGFTPWVTDNRLETLGVGTVEVLPRRILGLYDGSEATDLAYTNLHRLATLPLNHLGYTVEPHDVRSPLPTGVLTGTYAGIVVWVNSDFSGNQQKLGPWLRKKIEEGMRVVFLDHFGFSATRENLRTFDLNLGSPAKSITTSRISSKDASIGFEIQPVPRMDSFLPVTTNSGTPLLQLENDEKVRSDAVALTSWGGYALSPYTVVQLPDDQTKWVINPFEFFKRALRLPDMPVPDITTENGRRLMMVHVDGDGFIERTRWDDGVFAAESAYQHLFSRFRVPTTVSVIQGEIAANGLNRKLSPQLEQIARKIFSLPWVEIASHSFSHPFHWEAAVANNGDAIYHLDIPGYTFNLDTEIGGSVEYVNRALAPEGKRSRLFLWTGNCLPGEGALARVEKLGIGNLNGGFTLITESRKSVTAVSPLGIARNGQFQVYAPIQNENVYTNLWTGPFYGYERVMETFRLTDQPRRLKPINIYYHFYSASRRASLDALGKVYQWALGQQTFNLYASEYVDRVTDFNRTVIARDGEHWRIRNNGTLREFRIPAALGYPDLTGNSTVAGFSDHGDSRYIHAGPGGEAVFRLTGSPPVSPYLSEANGAITRLERTSNGLNIEFSGHQPLALTLGAMTGYNVAASDWQGTSASATEHLSFKSQLEHNAITVRKNP